MDATAREKTKIQTSSDALLQKAYDPPQQSGLLSGFSAAALWKATGWVSDADLSAEESASTLFRFLRSRHVRDLKLIFTAALLFAFLTLPSCSSSRSLTQSLGHLNRCPKLFVHLQIRWSWYTDLRHRHGVGLSVGLEAVGDC